MRSLTILLLLAFLGTPTLAQLNPTPRVPKPVSDPTMVVDDRGTKLEVLPAQRAEPQLAASRQYVTHSMFQTNPNAPVGPHQLGVVFNHAMQVYGYFTGEIAFQMKTGLAPAGIASFPGFAKLTGQDVYIVVARTPSEYVDLIKTLQRRTDLDWVEPIVIYGAR